MKFGRSIALAALLASLVTISFRSNEAAAQVGPVINRGIVAGTEVGWGYYPIVNGYWYWDYYGYPVLNPYGYSYFAYWNYLPLYATFGAISYSPATERVGVAWGQYDQWGAMNAASGYCGVADCSPVVWVQGGCAAVAKSPGSDFVGWGYHAQRFVADDYALRACAANGVPGCRIGAWVCSY